MDLYKYNRERSKEETTLICFNNFPFIAIININIFNLNFSQILVVFLSLPK